MILNQDQIDCINRHVQREGRDIVRDYHEGHLRGAKSHYADPPAVEATKEKLRCFHTAALEFVLALPLPTPKTRRGGGAR